jgi:hemerythrin-like domain-containing protein
MAATEKEILRMMGEHEGVRAHMNFLSKSLGGLAAQSINVKEQIWIYRWGLWDFREACRRHIVLDESIFSVLTSNALVGETLKEHEEIQRLLDGVIKLADNAVENELDKKELSKIAQDISKAFDKVSRLIEVHTRTEDKLLKMVQKDLLTGK